MTTASDLDSLALTAADAVPALWATTAEERGRWLRLVADALDLHADTLVALAQEETHLSEARLRGELGRTTYQLRSFDPAIRSGQYSGAIIQHADPGHPVTPAPDLRRVHRPLGPVAVYAASNFPFAFSVAGGDTASALAAGCPVIVKAHPGHPNLSRATAEIVARALADAGAPAGTFALVEGFEAGIALVRHPSIAAGAFTGSTHGGRALYDAAAARPVPIPFFGELGSINPVFVTVEAVQARPGGIAAGFVDSYTLGAGQLCTKPGVLVIPAGTRIPLLAAETAAAVPPAPMLTHEMAERLLAAEEDMATRPGVQTLLRGRDATPHAPSLFLTDAQTALRDPEIMLEERFGASAVIVEYSSPGEAIDIARRHEGTLTAAIHAERVGDHLVPHILPELERRAGRLLWNQWPTGVTVSPAMQHGGPYPSSTSAYTSVGATAVLRFLRPVSYQNFPEELLPAEVAEANPLRIPRQVVSAAGSSPVD